MSMMVGQVLMLTLAAASLDRSILMRGWVVRMQAALLTWESQHYGWLTSFTTSKNTSHSTRRVLCKKNRKLDVKEKEKRNPFAMLL